MELLQNMIGWWNTRFFFTTEFSVFKYITSGKPRSWGSQGYVAEWLYAAKNPQFSETIAEVFSPFVYFLFYFGCPGNSCIMHLALIVFYKRWEIFWTWRYATFWDLTLSPPITTEVPYANSLDHDETLSNSASHPNPSCLTLRQQFQQFSRQ